MEDNNETISPKRNDIFSNDKINLVEKDEMIKLALRKKFIEKYLQTSRIKEMLKRKTTFEINIDEIGISEEYKDFRLTDINKANEFQTLIFMLTSNNKPYVKFGVCLIRKFLSEYKSESTVIFQKKEIYDELIKIFLDKIYDYNIKFEIYWILINSTHDNQYLLSLIEDNEEFYQVLENDFNLENKNLNELIIWLCCHMLFDSKIFYLKFQKINIFKKVLKNLSSNINDLSSYTIHSLGLIHIFIKNKKNKIHSIPTDITNEIIFIMLKYSINFNHEEIRIHILFIIYFLLDNDDNQIKQRFLQNQQLLLNIMNFDYQMENKEIQVVIRIFGNLLRGDIKIVDYLLNNFNVMEYLQKIFKNCKKIDYHLEVLWCLSNLTAGSQSHILTFLTSDFYLLSRELLNSINTNIQYQSLKIFNNIICLDFFDISSKIIDEEFILSIINVLKNKQSNADNKIICLSLINNIFFIGNFARKTSSINQLQITNGNDKIEIFEKFDEINFEIKKENEYINFFLKNEGKEILHDLQLNTNLDIYKKSKIIIEKYFDFESD